MGPELETTGTERRFAALPRGRDPGSSARAFPKSLIYNISLMAGQTRGYEFGGTKMTVRAHVGTPARCWRLATSGAHKRSEMDTKCDANEKVSRAQAGGIRSLPTDGNMRHRPRTDRTGQTGKTMSHARSRAALRKITSVSLRNERKNAKVGGAVAGNFQA
jgi:hypothetical protein